MTNCLFVTSTLERHVLLIKNAIEPISSPSNAYGRSVVKTLMKSRNISQDKDTLLFYTGFQFPIILMYAINIDSVTTRLPSYLQHHAIKYRSSCLCLTWRPSEGRCISIYATFMLMWLRPWTTKSTLSWTASKTMTGSWQSRKDLWRGLGGDLAHLLEILQSEIWQWRPTK